MTHSLAIIYTRWFTPEGHENVAAQQEEKMSANVCKDLDMYEDAIVASEKAHGQENGYLVDGKFSLADVANAFTAEYSGCGVA